MNHGEIKLKENYACQQDQFPHRDLQLGTVDLLFPVDVTPQNGFKAKH
jgi:hypothetical protein